VVGLRREGMPVCKVGIASLHCLAAPARSRSCMFEASACAFFICNACRYGVDGVAENAAPRASVRPYSLVGALTADRLLIGNAARMRLRDAGPFWRV
jgi:hypothetical protein